MTTLTNNINSGKIVLREIDALALIRCSKFTMDREALLAGL